MKTEWTIYPTNEDVWLSILHDCANAKQSIVLEQFIFNNDDFGKRLLDICTERATKGIQIRFLWDAAGSFTFWGSNIAKDLHEKGIELLFWKTLIPSYFKVQNFRSWFLRNHRRTIVIDEKVGYTGSICVSDSMKNWRDINVRLEGPVVREMQNAFDRMWGRAKKNLGLPPKIHIRNEEFRYVTNYPAPGRRHIYSSLIHAIRHARQYIYITTPYFVPTHRLAHSLRLAAKRGVDVRIIIPESSDHYAVDLGARSFFHSLLIVGVRIFLYQGNGNMIHSKSVVIDDDWASVGTMNLDQISLLYNFEANIITTNTKFAEELASHFVHDMHDSKEVSLNEWKNRFFIEKIPEILIKIVRRFL
ncbi:MAG: phospholipase D-like domain-containing protein [Candidatus Paceibacterota bacterium]